MSKRKKRYYKRRKYRQRKARSNRCDLHHLCYQKRYWRIGYLGELRKFWYCTMYIPQETLHHEIHEEIKHIPVPKGLNAKGALEQLRMLEKHNAIHEYDPLDKRLMLLAALFDCCEQPTADAFRKQQRIAEQFYREHPEWIPKQEELTDTDEETPE